MIRTALWILLLFAAATVGLGIVMGEDGVRNRATASGFLFLTALRILDAVERE